MFEKLEKLNKLEYGWNNHGGLPLKSSSVKDFYIFWNKIKDMRLTVEPEFAPGGDGSLNVEWHKDWKHHLEIEFRGGSVCFYMLADGRSEHQGRTSINDLITFLIHRKNNPFIWGC